MAVNKFLKRLFWNPLTAAIELKFNKTQKGKEQNPLKSADERNLMNKYPLKSKRNLESIKYKKQVAKNLDTGYCAEIKLNKKNIRNS
ncbi:MAG: hypothetical protein OMM_11754 [Candidatus Magnetoglobus multicellularis str. Araruama]|uniref:Uncharacterized protein n=1 Tax=Candidatus Magnetoglobus multicellularis str. Araruama TaxID=890399 RepID=A0A1V1NXN1_9BACT|nr:MAG: hypothetical protein OMM_11754 [Candidatus Magnetoglobus multicellularis str. Araruama]